MKLQSPCPQFDIHSAQALDIHVIHIYPCLKRISVSPMVIRSHVAYLCLCLAFFEQIIYTYFPPFLLTLLHPSQSFFTELRTFIPRICCLVTTRLLCAGLPCNRRVWNAERRGVGLVLAVLHWRIGWLAARTCCRGALMASVCGRVVEERRERRTRQWVGRRASIVAVCRGRRAVLVRKTLLICSCTSFSNASTYESNR